MTAHRASLLTVIADLAATTDHPANLLVTETVVTSPIVQLVNLRATASLLILMTALLVNLSIEIADSAAMTDHHASLLTVTVVLPAIDHGSPLGTADLGETIAHLVNLLVIEMAAVSQIGQKNPLTAIADSVAMTGHLESPLVTEMAAVFQIVLASHLIPQTARLVNHLATEMVEVSLSGLPANLLVIVASMTEHPGDRLMMVDTKAIVQPGNPLEVEIVPIASRSIPPIAPLTPKVIGHLASPLVIETAVASLIDQPAILMANGDLKATDPHGNLLTLPIEHHVNHSTEMAVVSLTVQIANLLAIVGLAATTAHPVNLLATEMVEVSKETESLGNLMATSDTPGKTK
jgi:hypothetical protein